MSIDHPRHRAAHGAAGIAALAALAAALALGGCASPGSGMPACADTGPGVACTAQGAVRGTPENGTLAFKGIPYAAPPVGPLRWQPPAAPARWEGVRDGSRFGAICPQLVGKDVVGEEDCLTLNVWTPATPPSQPLPVMVFLTGGGNHSFSGQGSPGFGGVNYNGQLLVPQGMVYVSFNYRLGALGFLAHEALSAERSDKVSGNYGSQDQIAMLRWLQRNIANFGGDPQRITLFGTSAGGGNICGLMTTPAARGLFQRAAMQSSVPTGCELPTLADAQQGTGRRVAQALGCDQGDTAACLRGKATADIVRAVPGTFGVLPRLYGPNVDGQVFPEQPLAAIARGAHTHMPVIVGNTTQETMQFVGAVGPVTDAASYEAAIGKVFGPAAVPRVLATYPATAYATPRDALVQLTTDALFTCQSRRVVRTLARNQAEPVYRYLFAHTLDNDPEQKALGAVHTIEHAFLFPWQGKYRPTEADLAVQRLMAEHWTRFARAGNPGAAWPVAEPGDRFLRIAPAAVAQAGDAGAHCDLWDTVRLPWPHL
ncbi:carboxylesterase/lipase family protein [Ideonella sp. BN130291]|uniref:carboxylesterase/lipase family protein n=1 Tax=Ideonella sp. BN130291 TaxID=3112940 RepID=UPI002E26196D|nr:carboxylesterase family protein [Ideonella sp. BN130291]